MIQGKKLVIIMPAHNVEPTLEMTYRELPLDIVDDVVLIDDGGSDNIGETAKRIGIRHVVRHPQNRGYGGSQKSGYDKALELGADIVVMVHPDYQYTPKLVRAMASIVSEGLYHAVLGSRMLGGHSLRGGMPLWKFVANRFLTHFENIVIGEKLSEYHTGYRAFSRELLENTNYHANSNNFVFDNQHLSQIFMAKYKIAEVTCPTNYFDKMSSMSFRKGINYGLGVLQTSVQHFMHKHGLKHYAMYDQPKSK
jgi:glycosyltransferase involved in cell wall biosynthesis